MDIMMGARRGRPKGSHYGPQIPRSAPTTEFGHVLREIRLANGLTLRDFAVRMGYSEKSFTNIQKYESGEALAPEMPVILDWMRALGYDDFSGETRAMLRASLKDHLEEIAPGYARFIIEGER